MSLRVAVIGASGLLGNHLLREARRRGHAVSATGHSDTGGGLEPLDIRDAAALRRFLELHGPDVVLVAAAIGDVDRVEAHPGQARALNVDATLDAAAAVRERGARLSWYSTDYVFNGAAGPYREEHTVDPINEYGRQKAEVEAALAQSDPGALILRVSWLYGSHAGAKNFVVKTLATLARGDRVSAPRDLCSTPGYAPAVAAASLALAEAGRAGLWHVTGPDFVSRFDFALSVARVFGHDEGLVVEAPPGNLYAAAPRPARAGLDASRLRTEAGITLPDSETGLRLLAGELRTAHA